MSDSRSDRPITYTVGEEVLHDGRRWVVAAIVEGSPQRYRLLATTPDGARIAWAPHAQLAKMERYTRANDDTGRI